MVQDFTSVFRSATLVEINGGLGRPNCVPRASHRPRKAPKTGTTESYSAAALLSGCTNCM